MLQIVIYAFQHPVTVHQQIVSCIDSSIQLAMQTFIQANHYRLRMNLVFGLIMDALTSVVSFSQSAQEALCYQLPTFNRRNWFDKRTNRNSCVLYSKCGFF